MQLYSERVLRRAWRAYEAGDLAMAEKSFVAVLQGEPRNFDALHGLGLINYRRGRLDAALALMSNGFGMMIETLIKAPKSASRASSPS